MTYEETIEYLFAAAPLFQNIGAGAYKEGLTTTLTLDKHFGYPHHQFKTIHVAGTNGKGSTSHTLAAILQSAGYKVGLYTSPHLIDFRERIRINGEMIPENEVINFVQQHRDFFEPLYPSFFELTTAMAFNYFAKEKVDVAIIEVGLGGRLDCTNIITPVLSVITNVSLDHTQFLGNKIEDIAAEKAGIMKKGVTTIVGETTPETKNIYTEKAQNVGANIIWAENYPFPTIDFQLKGECQQFNARTIMVAAQQLGRIFELTDSDIENGFAHVVDLTHLRGRWETIQTSPQVIIDTGHNIGGWEYIAKQLQRIIDENKKLHIIFGVAADKEISTILSLLPKSAFYYFTQASVKRSLPVQELLEKATPYISTASAYTTVSQAYTAAIKHANAEDVIFIGGSTFVVADLLKHIES